MICRYHMRRRYDGYIIEKKKLYHLYNHYKKIYIWWNLFYFFPIVLNTFSILTYYTAKRLCRLIVVTGNTSAVTGKMTSLQTINHKGKRWTVLIATMARRDDRYISGSYVRLCLDLIIEDLSTTIWISEKQRLSNN